MIVVDTSALLAILLDEPDKLNFQKILARQPYAFISAVNAHEAAIVLRGRTGTPGVERLMTFLGDNRIEIVAFDELQVRVAAEAFGRFGKGIHSKARLNLCDCAAYALAKTRAAPLLFKGDDFPHTDIVAAV